MRQVKEPDLAIHIVIMHRKAGMCKQPFSQRGKKGEGKGSKRGGKHGGYGRDETPVPTGIQVRTQQRPHGAYHDACGAERALGIYRQV